MDSQEVPDNGNKGFLCMLLRIAFALLFPIFAFFSLSFLVGFVAVFIGELSIPNSITVPTQCKIVSSSVDIRASKICELGLLNYKAKHVFYHFERSKFRCRYDYYWTSVFEVEYRDHSLGQTRLAFTEAPNEALPLSCRPNFGAAWLTKDKFKVNETYDCWYTSGISKVKLYNDGFFSCQAKDPSTFEMIERYLIISTKILYSWLSSKGRAIYWKWETIAGVVTGFSTSIITISFIRILQHMKSWLPQALNTVHTKRACFLLVYFSVMGWLVSQYWRRLNIPVINVYNY
ncbi:uncharacterized protein LOC110428155 [Herrania umbratica]|uniref:Uncharacterized protein LOC110428155 n=1 Tax=Herrania umbratica TaxID=108875 RepID=A0A6J1BJ00_9ROSI|nr:uncharacterized protein LOC110428155 [Herrania umbratica]